MPDALSPQFGQMSTPPKPPTPISAPKGHAPTLPPLALSAGTMSSFQQHTAWRTPTGMPYSAQAGGRSVLDFSAGESVNAPTGGA